MMGTKARGFTSVPAVSPFGFTRASVYTKRQTAQEQAIHASERKTYLIVYPFS